MFKVALVDDSPEIVTALRKLLSRIDGVEVVGTAESVDEARQLIAATHPDLVVLDAILAGDGAGLEVLRYIARECIDTDVIALSNVTWQVVREGYVHAGANAYFDKSFELQQALDWIRKRAQGVGHSGAGSAARPCSSP